MFNNDSHIFIFRPDNISYRASAVLDECAFECYMDMLDWVLPLNIRVAHSGTASQSVLQSFPALDIDLREFLTIRKGIMLKKNGTQPVPVKFRWQDFLIIPSSLNIPQLIRFNSQNSNLIFSNYYAPTFNEAAEFINLHHRHCAAPQGHKFSIGLLEDGITVGVIMASIPRARAYNDRHTLELIRCCVLPNTENGCSKLYARAIKAGRSMGYGRFITYTLLNESGSSLKAVGFKLDGRTRERRTGWDTPSRPRRNFDRYPCGPKNRWVLQYYN